jgi:hypothetical protein
MSHEDKSLPLSGFDKTINGGRGGALPCILFTSLCKQLCLRSRVRKKTEVL